MIRFKVTIGDYKYSAIGEGCVGWRKKDVLRWRRLTQITINICLARLFGEDEGNAESNNIKKTLWLVIGNLTSKPFSVKPSVIHVRKSLQAYFMILVT